MLTTETAAADKSLRRPLHALSRGASQRAAAGGRAAARRTLEAGRAAGDDEDLGRL